MSEERESADVTVGLSTTSGGARERCDAMEGLPMSETRAVITEFGGSKVSMAAEILRLRAALEDVRFDLSRAALAGVSGVLLDPMPRPGVTPRPVGYRITDD